MKETELEEQINKIIDMPVSNCEMWCVLTKEKLLDLIQQREAEAIRRLHRLLHKRIKRSNSIKTDNTGNYKLDTRAKRISYKNGFNVSLGMTHKLLDHLAERRQDEVQG